MNIHRSIGLFLTGTCAIAAAGPVYAEDVKTQGAAAQSTQTAQLAPTQAQAQPQDDQNAIIITAEKRPQVLLDVPQSVSVVTGGTLEQQHANDIQDYLKLVPGLQLGQSRSGEGRLIIRGLNAGGVASTVSVYVDETPFGSSTGLLNGGVLAGDFDTFDLNRIEVLRGPQGTLYGASSLGGVLRFVTNAPSTAGFEARGRAGIETVSNGGLGYIADAVINVPLSPTIAFRASGNYRKDAGFIDSTGIDGSDRAKDINGGRSFGGRASLLFQPSDSASIRLSAVAQNIDADQPDLIEADPVTLKPLHGLTQSRFASSISDLHYRIYDAVGNFNLGFANLTTATSFEKQDQTLRNDLTVALSSAIAGLLGPNEFVEPQLTNLKKFTQEVRLSGQTAFADWLVGGFYTHEDGLLQQDLVALEPGTLTPIPLPSFLGSSLGHLTLTSKYKEIAGFANATLHLTQQFDLQFGGRYSKNKQSSEQLTNGALLGAPTDNFGNSSEHVFTYSVAPKFKIDPNTTIYARVAKGFRPGGPNAIAPSAPADLRTFHSDSVVSWEAGVKTQTPDHRFSLDAAAFHINWKDIQLATTVIVIDPVTQKPIAFGVNINGSSAKSDGFEATATARPIPGLDLSFNAAYTNARLTGSTPADVGGFKGDQLPFTPKLSLAALADYHWQLGPGMRAHVGGSLRHLSGQSGPFDAQFVADHGHQRHVRPYSVIDLDAGVNFGHFDVEAYVKNLANSRGVTSIAGTVTPIFPDGAIGTGIIRPRTIGVTLGFNY